MSFAVASDGANGSKAMQKEMWARCGNWLSRWRSTLRSRRNRPTACAHDGNKLLPAHLGKEECGRLLFQVLRTRECVRPGADHHHVGSMVHHGASQRNRMPRGCLLYTSPSPRDGLL